MTQCFGWVRNNLSLTVEDFQLELNPIFARTNKLQSIYVDVRSGDLHATVGNYPSRNLSMPVLCKMMRTNMKNGDEILCQPRRKMAEISL